MKQFVFLLGACSAVPAPVAPKPGPPTVVASDAPPPGEPADAAVKQLAECPRELLDLTDGAAVQAFVREHSCNGNAYETYGKSALMKAVEQGRLDVARALIAAGANVNWALPSGNGDGMLGVTALWFALKADRPDIVAALLRAGADPNQKPSRALPPLVLAAQNESPACAKLLIEAGVDREQTSHVGATAMSFPGGPSAHVFVYLESIGAKTHAVPDEVQASLRWEVAHTPKPDAPAEERAKFHAEVARKTKSRTARKFAIKHLIIDPPQIAVPALIETATGLSIDQFDWGPHDAIVALHEVEWTADLDKAAPKLLAMMAKDDRQQVRLQLLSLFGKRGPTTKAVVDSMLARLERGEDRANAAMALGDMMPRASADHAKRIRKALERASKGPTGDCKGAEQCARVQTTEAARKALGP